jgi:hypothetical protein
MRALPIQSVIAVLVAASVLVACGGDDEPDAACARWEAIQGRDISDTEAVERLNEIADEAEDENVRDRALELAILLEGTATQTEVGAAYEDLDAACQVD